MRYGLVGEKLSHSFSKEIHESIAPYSYDLFSLNRQELDAFFTKNPKTLHALTGSLVAEQIFGETDAVITAIRYHTTGRPDMSLLEKIIYIADYIEANRNFPGVEEMRKAAFEDLDVALLMGLESATAHVRRQGQELAAATTDAVKFLRDRGVKLPDEV